MPSYSRSIQKNPWTELSMLRSIPGKNQPSGPKIRE